MYLKNSDSWSLKWHVHKYKAPCEFLDFFECFVKIQSMYLYVHLPREVYFFIKKIVWSSLISYLLT